MREHHYDLVAIGGGTAGLVTASGAAHLGARAALVEREALGGDCLWTGCVPSKALVASARLARAMREGPRLGLESHATDVDFARVMARMREARGRVARHDDPGRFRAMGVGVHLGEARWTAPGVVEVEGVGRIRAGRFVVATGAIPALPPVEGLEEAGYLTHRTAFDADHLPGEIVILGAGAVGMEMAQLYARLGARVTVVEARGRVLPGSDPEAAGLVRAEMEREGIRFRVGTPAVSVVREGGRKVVATADGRRVACDEILVATGRRPSTAGLGLERAGVETDAGAVRVDRALRTTARGVWAAGDVTGGRQFTHRADHMARTVVRNALLPFPRAFDDALVPSVTFTDPEIAEVGLGEEEAGARGGVTHRLDLADLDRAVVDGRTEGFVKVSTDRRGRVLGATVVAPGAGDVLQPVILAMRHGLGAGALADAVFPYPTWAEGIGRAATGWRREQLRRPAGRLLRRIVGWLA